MPLAIPFFQKNLSINRFITFRLPRLKLFLMNTKSKPVLVAFLLAASLGSALFSGGCAATSTQPSTGQYIDDSSITVKVKAAFVKDPLIKAFDVSVETFKGVVQLSGFVNTAAEKEQAGKVAATINGVTEVKNNIVVK